MTDEQINIAIAESLGWTNCRLAIKGAGGGARYLTAHGIPPNRKYEALCPNYTADLNAMHKAMLLHPRKDLLRKFLYLEVLEDPTNTTNEPAWATAKQWATAYVKSLGKWSYND